MAAWPDLARSAELWVLPAECMAGLAPLGPGDDALICSVCRARWRAIPDPRCRICGEPLLIGIGCRLCVDWPAGFGPVRSAVWLDERARHAVHRLKYDGWWRITDSLARAMVGLAPLEPGSVLVPIPALRHTRAAPRL